MAKVTEYSRITKMKDNDVLLVDGPDGTRTILQTDASKQMGGEVIMVNETAGDSTKVVINTTDEEIELATMADLEPVEEDVDELKESINYTEDKVQTIESVIYPVTYDQERFSTIACTTGQSVVKTTNQMTIAIEQGEEYYISINDPNNVLGENTSISVYENISGESAGTSTYAINPDREYLKTATKNIGWLSIFLTNTSIVSNGNIELVVKTNVQTHEDSIIEITEETKETAELLYTNIGADFSWTVGKWINMGGSIVNNSWTAMSSQPIGNIADVIKLNDSTGGHLFYEIVALDYSWNYVGRWNGDTKTFVSDYEYKIYDAIYHLEEIKELYPNYLLFLILIKDNGGMTSTLTNDISVLRKKNDVITYVNASNISWVSGQLSTNGGIVQPHANAISSVDFIPDCYKYFIATTNARLQVWSANEEYLGIWSFPDTISHDSTYTPILNLEALRTIVSGCKVKIVIYDVGANPENANLSHFLRNDIEFTNEKIAENPVYQIPHLFSLSALHTITGQTGHRVQGMAADDNYLYVAEMTDTTAEETAETIIHKIDSADGTEVGYSSGLVLGHANSMCYDPNNDYLLVVYTIPSNRYLMYRIDTETLTLVDTIDLHTIMANLGTGDTNPSGISYIPDCNGFIIYSAVGYVIVNNDFTSVIRIIKRPYNSLLYGQNTCAHGDVLFQTYWLSDPSTYWIYSYDWHGNVIDKLNIPWHVQSMVFIGNDLYFLVENTDYIVYSVSIDSYRKVDPSGVQMQFNLNY